jgi:hypothetical protein
MTHIRIAPLTPASAHATTLASLTAAHTISGGVKYRSSGMSDAESARMTKAMRDHRRMDELFAEYFAPLSVRRATFDLIGGPSLGWFSPWPAAFKRARQVLADLDLADGGRDPCATLCDRTGQFSVDPVMSGVLASMHAALPLNNN